MLDAVRCLLGVDTLDIKSHLPRLVQFVEDALTQAEWQAAVTDRTREQLRLFVRDKGPAIPEMRRNAALRELMLASRPFTPLDASSSDESPTVETLLLLSNGGMPLVGTGGSVGGGRVPRLKNSRVSHHRMSHGLR